MCVGTDQDGRKLRKNATPARFEKKLVRATDHTAACIHVSADDVEVTGIKVRGRFVGCDL
jgi:hypothetical protein